MLTLIGSLLGFGTSFLPKVMEYFQDRQDKAHELKLMAVQAEIQERIAHVKLQAVHVDAGIREAEALLKHDSSLHKRASQWVVNLAASVRPVVTYLYFAEFVLLTFLLAAGYIAGEQFDQIWDAETKALFATIVTFWFGNRLFGRRQST